MQKQVNKVIFSVLFVKFFDLKKKKAFLVSK